MKKIALLVVICSVSAESAEPTIADRVKAGLQKNAESIDPQIDEKQRLIDAIRKGKESIKVNKKPASRAQQIEQVRKEISELERKREKLASGSELPGLAFPKADVGDVGSLYCHQRNVARSSRILDKLSPTETVVELSRSFAVPDGGRVRQFDSVDAIVLVRGVKNDASAIGDGFTEMGKAYLIDGLQEWTDNAGRKLKIRVVIAVDVPNASAQ